MKKITIVRTYEKCGQFQASNDRMFRNFQEALQFIETELKQGKKAVIL